MSRWLRVRSWFRSVIRRSQLEREIDDELRFHVEEEAHAGIRAGLTSEQARRAAYASLGGAPALVREQCRDQRGVSFVDDLARDLTHGGRLLRRNAGFAIVALATLAIGIGATVTVFSIVDAWLFRPLNFPEADRLVIGFAARPERPTEPAVWMPYRAYLGWRERSRSFTSVSAAIFRGVTVTTAPNARSVVGLNVTPEFFQTLGVAPLLGRTLVDADVTGTPTVVLSHGFWQHQFGGSNSVIGTSITLSDVPHEIVGIMPSKFDVRILDRPEGAEFWTAFRAGEPTYEPTGIGPVAIIGRLRHGIAIDAAQSEVAAITREIESGYQFNFNRFVVNLSSLQADNTRTVRTTLLTVSAAVVCLLLIASMNVGTLLLGRGLGRLREAAIRVAIGSGRTRLIRQFLTESLLISLIGGIAGLVLTAVATRLFVAWNPLGQLPPNAIRLDPRALVAAGAAMVMTTIVCGLVPALRVSTADPNEALRAGGGRAPTTAPGQRAQAAMLIGQVAVSVVLLVSATLLIRTFVRLQAAPLGFDTTSLSVASIVLPNDPFDSSDRRNTYYRQLADRIRALPGVRAVAAGTSLPLNNGAPVTVNTSPDDSLNASRISAQEVTTEFFETLGIPVLMGRTFAERDRSGQSLVVMLNARAAEDLFGGSAEAIGRRVRLDREPWREVVGVVGSVRSTFFNTLEWRTDPIVYRPAAQAFTDTSSPTATSFGFNVHIRSDRPLTMADVRDAASLVSPRAAVTDFRRVSDMVAEATRQPAFRMTLLFGFAAISLLLAAIGTYGLVSQAVAQRFREIAIRLALGADPAGVVGVITRGALAAGIIGLGIGALAAFMLGDVLEALLYGVRSRDAMSFVAAAVSLLVVTAVAAFVPAVRAVRVDPAKVLRAE